jgi:hypothetical protein
VERSGGKDPWVGTLNLVSCVNVHAPTLSSTPDICIELAPRMSGPQSELERGLGLSVDAQSRVPPWPKTPVRVMYDRVLVTGMLSVELESVGQYGIDSRLMMEMVDEAVGRRGSGGRHACKR